MAGLKLNETSVLVITISFFVMEYCLFYFEQPELAVDICCDLKSGVTLKNFDL